MDWITHKTSKNLIPILFIGEPFERKHVLDYLWKTSPSASKLPFDFNIQQMPACYLNPKNEYKSGESHYQFNIDKYVFKLRLSELQEVEKAFFAANERIPGYMRLALNTWFIILPKDIYQKVLTTLYQLKFQKQANAGELTQTIFSPPPQ